jgi:hypothetical protein
VDIYRSVPLVEPIQSNEPIMANPRARRAQARRSNPLPMNGQEKDLNFLSNLQQNDTLQRRRRDQQLNNHSKHYQQPSSSDEQDTSPMRPANDNASQPIIVNINCFSIETQPKNLSLYLILDQLGFSHLIEMNDVLREFDRNQRI